MKQKKRFKKWLFRLCAAIGGPVLLLVLIEASTRIFWHYNDQEQHIGIILKDANRAVAYKGITYTTNSYGLRNKEVATKKSLGTKRVLALGDSFTWGDGLPADELITVKMEKLLLPDFPGVEVINGSYSDANTGDEFRQLVRLVPIFKPDIVAVFFFTNDVLSKNREALSWRMNLKEYLRKHSKFFAFVYYKIKTKYGGAVSKSLLPADYFDLDDSKAGWVEFKKALLQIRDYCKERNIELQFVVIPTLTSLNKNYPYMELREKVVGFAKNSGIHTLDLFDCLSPFDPAKLWVSPENMHWNDMGTSIAAAEVVKNIKILLDKPMQR
jgi:lysophospholipase L1-like esterase